MHDTLRRALCLAVIGVSLAGCSVTSPVLHPPAGRGARDVSRDMAECEAASTPGIGTYAKAAGQGLLARIASPFVGIAAALTGGRAAAAPGAAEAGSLITPPSQQGDQRGAVMAIAGIGTVVGLVAGPFVGYHLASETVRDARQDRFERCLVARGYAPPPAPRAPRVLVLVATDMTRPSAVQAFRGELERRGYAFGTTLDVELQWWDGPQAADRSVLTQGWDIIVAGSGEIAVAVQQTLPQTPIILAASELDPVATGLARSHERPRRNVSGLTLAAAELNAPRVELLLRAVPHVTRLAVLANPDNADHALSVEAIAGMAGTVDVRRVDVRADADLDETIRGLVRDGVDALLVLPDPMLRRRRDEIAALAGREKLPAIAGEIGFADAGGLLEYHPGLDASWREAATFVDQVLKGAAPAWLPIRTVRDRDVVLNVRTAEALGLTLPSRVLLSATRVVR